MNCACWDLCGGRPVMGVPTAIVGKLHPHETLADLRIPLGKLKQDIGQVVGVLSADVGSQVFLAGGHGQDCAGRCKSETPGNPCRGPDRGARLYSGSCLGLWDTCPARSTQRRGATT